MGLKYSHKKQKAGSKIPLFADRGRPGPNIFTLIKGSAFSTFVDSLPKVENSTKVRIFSS